MKNEETTSIPLFLAILVVGHLIAKIMPQFANHTDNFGRLLWAWLIPTTEWTF